jgi:phospholipid/cholesterol/gamma-HCH transport system substrate-binding protein
VSLLRRRNQSKPSPVAPVPDERVWGRNYHGPSPWVVGLVLVGILAIASYLAFSKQIPFTSHGYELHATFDNAATLGPNAPVRIAGVNVGKVTSVEPNGDAAEVTFTVDDEGQPIHDDAEITIRPRLFLEGNFFLDVRPGSPSAPELSSGADIPVTQTSTAVQLDQVLTALQSDSRKELQKLLEGFGTGLTYVPTAADDATQDPSVQGLTAAQALNDSFRYGGKAGKGTAIVNQALLGEHPHDLSGLIGASQKFFGRLADRETQLKGLITNFNTTAGAFASESANLSASLRELAPTLEEAQPSLRHLSEALPPVRAWARVLEPNIRPLPGTIKAAEPWLAQANLLLRDSELGGLAKLLGESAPDLAKTTQKSQPLLKQVTLLSRCATSPLDVTADTPITIDPLNPGNTRTNWDEFLYGTVNLSGESSSFDGNGQYLRFQSGGGPNLVKTPNPTGAGNPENDTVEAQTIDPPAQMGLQPKLPADQPPFRLDVPCFKNAPPDINGSAASAQPSDFAVGP